MHQQSTVEECERQPEVRREGDESQVEARAKVASAMERSVQAGERREEGERPVQASDFDERQPEARYFEAKEAETREADNKQAEVRGVHARQKERQVATEDVTEKLDEEPLPETFINLSYI